MCLWCAFNLVSLKKISTAPSLLSPSDPNQPKIYLGMYLTLPENQVINLLKKFHMERFKFILKK